MQATRLSPKNSQKKNTRLCDRETDLNVCDVQLDCKPSFFFKQMLLIVVPLIEDFKKGRRAELQFFSIRIGKRENDSTV